MDREKAIKILEPGCEFPDFPHTVEDVDEACQMAVAALRAQQDMTREEAIEILSGVNIVGTTAYLEALGVAAAALLESAHQTTLGGSQWEGCHYCGDQETVMELDWIYGLDHILPDYKFCPMCGRPLTEEACVELERGIQKCLN